MTLYQCCDTAEQRRGVRGTSYLYFPVVNIRASVVHMVSRNRGESSSFSSISMRRYGTLCGYVCFV